MKPMNECITKNIIKMQQIWGAMQERAKHAPQGQGLVEYALILAFVTLMIVVAMKFLQPAVSHALNQTACNLTSAGEQTPVVGATPCP